MGGVANTSAPMGHAEYLNVITFNFSFLQCAFELVSVTPCILPVESFKGYMGNIRFSPGYVKINMINCR